MASEQRLIDANKLESKLQEHHDFFVDGIGGFRFLSPKDKARVDEITNCIAEVCNAPTVDAVVVVHGRWIPIPASTPDGWRDNKTGERVYPMCCSVCGDVYMNGPYKYCPSCGAKMDGDGNG